METDKKLNESITQSSEGKEKNLPIFFPHEHILFILLLFLNSLDKTEQDAEEEIKVNCPCGNDEVRGYLCDV